MTPQQITDKVIKVISKISGYKTDKIKLSHNLTDDLWFDNLDKIDLATSLESIHEIHSGSNEYSEAINWQTVQDVVSTVLKLTGNDTTGSN